MENGFRDSKGVCKSADGSAYTGDSLVVNKKTQDYTKHTDSTEYECK